jgi:peptidoglycan glycosyltransferase
MNAPLRRVGVVVILLFGLLFANLNWVQGYKADAYRTSDYNGRVQVAEYQRQRGVIAAGRDSKALATSRATDDELKYLRTYPFNSMYAHVVGYKPVNGVATGIEKSENDFLAGNSTELIPDRVRDLFTGDQTAGGNVLLTLSRRAQETAQTQLADNRKGVDKGAVVAIDPRTGAVQAMVSMPSFNPNPLVSHNAAAAQAAYTKLEQDPDKPLLNRATQETLPPGSTFKVIDTAAALQNGYTPDTKIPAGSSYTPPQTTQEIHNAASSICPGSQVSLLDALTHSCNTGFAQLGVKLGGTVLKDTARAFGFEDDDLTCGRLNADGLPVAASHTGDMQRPDGQEDPATVAQSAIGQRDVRMTPLQAALIAATVANNGVQMRPYLVQQLQGPDLTTIHYRAAPEELRRPISDQVAQTMQGMMVNVVERGTGTNAQIDGYTVGGKTGTAQDGDRPDHGWFIGYVMKDGQPISAVAVMLQNAGSGGSAEAARIAQRVMRAVTQDRGGD